MKTFKFLARTSLGVLLLAGSAAAVAAEPKGVLRFGIDLQSRHFNTFRQIGDTFATLVYEGLVQFAPDGFTILPRLATSWEQSPSKVTFKLRKGVVFHDGTPFNAAAVIANFERMIASKGQFATMLEPVAKMSAPDDHTVVLDLKYPAPTLLPNLATRGALIISPKNIENKDFAQNPQGTAPWTLNKAESKHGTKIVVDYFDKYYAPEKVGAKRIELYSIPDQNTLLNALVTGKVDIATLLGQLVPVAEAQGFKTVSKPVLIHRLLMLDRKKTFADENVRKAICHAVDPKVWVSAVLNGRGRAINQRFSKGTPGYYPDIKGHQHDLEKARKYMAAAGNPSISFTFPTYPTVQQVAQLLKSQLAKIGVKVNIELMTPGQYFSFYQSNKYPLQINTSATENSGVYDYYKFRFSPTGIGNPFRVEIPELDKLAATALAETDPKKQDRGWHSVVKYINDHALDCGFYEYNTNWIYNPKRIANFASTAMKPTALRYRDIRLK